jgi:hypothetical protein
MSDRNEDEEGALNDSVEIKSAAFQEFFEQYSSAEKPAARLDLLKGYLEQIDQEDLKTLVDDYEKMQNLNKVAVNLATLGVSLPFVAALPKIITTFLQADAYALNELSFPTEGILFGLAATVSVFAVVHFSDRIRGIEDKISILLSNTDPKSISENFTRMSGEEEL